MPKSLFKYGSTRCTVECAVGATNFKERAKCVAWRRDIPRTAPAASRSPSTAPYYRQPEGIGRCSRHVPLFAPLTYNNCVTINATRRRSDTGATAGPIDQRSRLQLALQPCASYPQLRYIDIMYEVKSTWIFSHGKNGRILNYLQQAVSAFGIVVLASPARSRDSNNKWL